jgi:hypothetical protein
MTIYLSKHVAYVITLCNKNSCADLQVSITIRIQAIRHVFIQILHSLNKVNFGLIFAH